MAGITDMMAIEYAVLNPLAGQRFNLEVWADEAKAEYPHMNLHIRTKYAKYSMQIVDAVDEALLAARGCAAFLVPQGQEYSWLYTCDEG
jgi:hypothetical protein